VVRYWVQSEATPAVTTVLQPAAPSAVIALQHAKSSVQGDPTSLEATHEYETSPSAQDVSMPVAASSVHGGWSAAARVGQHAWSVWQLDAVELDEPHASAVPTSAAETPRNAIMCLVGERFMACTIMRVAAEVCHPIGRRR